MSESAARLTGYEPDAETGMSDAPPVLRLDSKKLPIRIEFGGKKFILMETKMGGLILNRTY